MDSCPICCDKFTEYQRKDVECQYCKYKACVKCIKQYVLSNYQDANCMNCHMQWNKEFLDNHLSKSFMTNEYKKHRENVLVEREKSLLPATVVLVEREKRRRANNKLIDELMEQREKLYKQANDIQKTIDMIRRNIYYDNELRGAGEASTSNDVKEKKIFVKACPADGCRGFLSTQWKCGICETWVCPDCHEIKMSQKDENHVCIKENVETAKMLTKECKSCPKCASAIYRVTGCSMMWCTICHTTFDWNSGKEIVTRSIHNPEYLDWVRRTKGSVPRAEGDLPLSCGGFPNYITVNHWITKYKNIAPEKISKLHTFFRWILHIQDIELRYNTNIVTDNQDLRIGYLMNDFDEEHWKRTLQKREKTNEIKTSKRQINEMIVIASSDILNALISSKKSEDILNYLNELDGLIEHYNGAMFKIGERFHTKVISKFDDKWKWKSR